MKTWNVQAVAGVVLGVFLGLSVDAMAMARKPTEVAARDDEETEAVNLKLVDLRGDDLSQMEGADIGIAAYGGNGCPAGSLLPDQFEGKTVLKLDAFEARLRPQESINRVACNLAIPLTAHEGYQVAVRSLVLAGSVDVSALSTARIHSEIFFAGSQGNTLSAHVRNASGGFLYRNTNAGDLQWSKCGSSAIARANVSLVIQGQQANDFIRAGIMALEIVTRQCE